MSRHAKIEVFEGKGGQWYFRVRSANGEPISQSEGYVSRSNAERAKKALIETVNAIAADVHADPPFVEDDVEDDDPPVEPEG